jgi:DNA-binding HxlR family transcriptional regulator
MLKAGADHSRMMWELLNEDLHPYVVFLPSEQKIKVLSAIFGSKAAVDILRFSLRQGISNKIYQGELVRKLTYSNKTVIETLKSLTKLGILREKMEKAEKSGRITWVKTYQLSEAGKWFALLLAEEKELSDKEKTEIFQSLFRAYLGWAKALSRKLNMEKGILERVFREEMQ